jgi:membrane protein YdbS with pleckstrin-like domain
MAKNPHNDSSTHRQRRFASKRDLWLVLVLWGAALGLLFASMDVAGSQTHAAFKIVFVVACIMGAALIPWILYGTSYTLTNEALLIRCGPFRHRVMVSTIQEVAPSRNPVSSPACSLDRLHIKYQGSRHGVLISPGNKRSFLEELSRLDSQLSLQGDRIVRSA